MLTEEKKKKKKENVINACPGWDPSLYSTQSVGWLTGPEGLPMLQKTEAAWNLYGDVLSLISH